MDMYLVQILVVVVINEKRMILMAKVEKGSIGREIRYRSAGVEEELNGEYEKKLFF